MKKNLPLILKAFICLLLTSQISFAQNVYEHYVDGKIYLKFENHLRPPSHQNGLINPEEIYELNGLIEDFGIYKVRHPFHMTNSKELIRTIEVHFSEINKVEQLIALLQENITIEYAEKMPLHKISYTPNDLKPQTGSTNQSELYVIQAEAAWSISQGNSSVTVAIVDNAIDISHSDLIGALWTNPGEIPNNNIDDDGNGYIDDIHGWDAADNDNNPNPPNTGMDHGTHCSGIAAAHTDNNNGIASIGFGISLIAVKSNADNAGNTAVTNGYDGIVYATASGADIISCSWGGPTGGTTGQNVINNAYNNGAIIVVAAGNHGTNQMHYPAAYNNVIAVANTQDSDVKANSSAYGTWVDISAPGTNILSTLPGNTYASYSGTSMACPMVAGLLGLMYSVDPVITRAQVESCLYSSADNIDAQNPSYIGQLGAGRINALAALQCVQAFANPVPPVSSFVASDSLVCVNSSVNFTCLTSNATTFSWSFPGGSPASSTQRNPSGIVYNTPGSYSVTLTTTNTYGNDTKTKVNYIVVDPNLTCPITLPSTGTFPTQTSCTGRVYDDGGPNGNYSEAGPNNNLDSYITISPTGATSVTINFNLFDLESGDQGPGICNYDWLEVFDGPTTSSPSLGKFCGTNIPPSSLTSTGGSITLHMHSDPYATGAGFDISWTCNQTTDITNQIFEEGSLNLYPNPTNNLLNVQFGLKETQNVELKLINMIGQTVYQYNFGSQSNMFKSSIDMSTLSKGTYTLFINNVPFKIVRQ